MAVEQYKNPYDSQINDGLVADNKQLDADRTLFENQDMVKIIETYLEESVPQAIKDGDIYKTFWASMGKKIQLTFLEDEDKFDFEAMFRQTKMLYLMSIPKKDKTFETLTTLKQMEMYFVAAVRSAIGVKDNRFNERIVQASTIRQNISSNSESFRSSNGGKGGMFGWLSKMF